MGAARFTGLLALIATTSFAQPLDPLTRGFDTVPTKATPLQNSGIAISGAELPSAGSYQLVLLLDVNFGILALRRGSDEKLGDLIPVRPDAHLMFSWALIADRLELAVDLPFTLFQQDNFQLLRDQGVDTPGVASFGLGDLRLLPRLGILSQESAPVGLALVTELRLPTGDDQSFLGERSVVFAPQVSVERQIGPVAVLGQAGVRLRKPGQFFNLYVGNEATFGAGAIVNLPDVWRLTQFKALGEVHLATPLEDPFTFENADSLKTPFELLAGVRARVAPRWGAELHIGRGLGLESGYGREAFRLLASVRYQYEAADRDADGIPDDEDACPDDPEDRDGFEDSDGCPDPDNDKDGVLDVDDKCPDKPGPVEFEGCPDTDLDEVPDNVDKCPEIPGPPENDGCEFEDGPAVTLESDRIRVRGNINYETGSAKIQRQSFKLLDEVATVLLKNPVLGTVVIEGHTDNVGSRAYNLDLSKRRAKSVVEYLVKKGVERKRLRSEGFGFEKPIATNATPLGRAKNRRTEFRLLKDGEAPAGEKPLEQKENEVEVEVESGGSTPPPAPEKK